MKCIPCPACKNPERLQKKLKEMPYPVFVDEYRKQWKRTYGRNGSNTVKDHREGHIFVHYMRELAHRGFKAVAVTTIKFEREA